MGTVLVSYTAKPEKAADNQPLVENVFKELNEANPNGLRYMTLRFEGNHFAHIAQVDGDENPLAKTTAFPEFQKEIKERCVEGEGPNPVDAIIVGSYGFGGASG
ncbi:MAG: hypothetical protein ACR2N5_06100 [Solirubrobacterales bacterium]